MKKKFSAAWKGSSQIRKQRKYLANAPVHLKRKIMAANLSKELRKKYGKRSFPVRKGDEAKIMFGASKGKKGKISEIKIGKGRVAIEGIQNKKKDGTKINVWFHASNLQIQELNLNDKKRIEALNRKETQKKLISKDEKKSSSTNLKEKKKNA
jgi:large subunit ribosomal protein L24